MHPKVLQQGLKCRWDFHPEEKEWRCSHKQSNMRYSDGVMLRPLPTILLPKFFQWVESLLSRLFMCRHAIPWLLQEILHADRFCCSSEALLWSNLNCICDLVVYWGLTLNHLVALRRYYSQKVVSWWKCGAEASPFYPKFGTFILYGFVCE